ncbi:MAG: bifunctional cytidylyltransferase/SDR family oxidoreductase [Sulfuricurvum sp.]|uniref:SDR family NAD(P)-dependent oxidoreductase n=1 Tax=Sulfuricurvum sp. TaxID=2025608 RepID=UPI003565B15C
MNTKNIAVILSGGSGTRFGAEKPKQYLHLAGRMIIEYTVEVFQNHPLIDEICIIADPEFHDTLQTLCSKNHYDKARRIIRGGAQRSDSSFAAITEYGESDSDVNLIFHDAVRPFVSQSIISATIAALEKYSAVDVAIPSADTIIQINPEDDTIDNIPVRSILRRGQTPQAFALSTIKKAHLSLQTDLHPISVTDDCGLVKHYLPDTPVYVVPGEERNIKITYPEDLLFAEKLIQLNSRQLTSDQGLSLLKDQIIVIYGGNSGIGKEIAVLGSEAGAICLSFSRSNGIDLQNASDIQTSLDQVVERYGRIDHIINCAALLNQHRLDQTDETVIEEMIRTNFTGTTFLCKYGFHYLRQSQGSLTLFTSSSYTQGRPFYALYSSTKAAIVNLTQALSQEWQSENVRINAINPARTKTPMRTQNFGEEPEDTLLDAKYVARKTLQSLLSNYSGLIIDIKKGLDG